MMKALKARWGESSTNDFVLSNSNFQGPGKVRALSNLDADIMIHLLGLGWPCFVCVKYALLVDEEEERTKQRGDVTMERC